MQNKKTDVAEQRPHSGLAIAAAENYFRKKVI
jgi:hypothetical protein